MPSVSTPRTLPMSSSKSDDNNPQASSRQPPTPTGTSSSTSPPTATVTTTSSSFPDDAPGQTTRQARHHQHHHHHHQQQPQTQTHLSLVTCLLAISLFLAASGMIRSAEGFPRHRRHFFTTCWGWGASCSHSGGSSSSSVGGASGRSSHASRVTSRPRQDRRTNLFDQRFGYRHSGRLASPFTSTNWGAGTLGKRNSVGIAGSGYNPALTNDRMEATRRSDFLEQLGRAVALRQLLELTSGKLKMTPTPR